MDSPQIVQHIARKVLHDSSLADLASFRRTSRLINSIVEPLLFETVEIALQGRVVGSRSVRLLDVLAKKKRLCLLVKRVKIHSLNASAHHKVGPLNRRVQRQMRSLDESLAMIGMFSNTREVVWHIWSHSTLYETYSSLLFSILSSSSSLLFLSSLTLSLLGSGSQAQLILPPEAARLGSLSVLKIQCPTPTPTPTLETSPPANPGQDVDEDASDSHSHFCPYPTVHLEQTLFEPILGIIDNSPDLRLLQVDFRPPPLPGQPEMRVLKRPKAAQRNPKMCPAMFMVDRYLEDQIEVAVEILYQQRVDAFVDEIQRRKELVRTRVKQIQRMEVYTPPAHPPKARIASLEMTITRITRVPTQAGVGTKVIERWTEWPWARSSWEAHQGTAH
ncbi:hypothetical protein D9758_004979 [Tetrapyrgos nigripes]|uniref:F-box domain-containing protein n=1 Tax=Tetrapyrgos nigripes TaxID=182062 RepID=A0A8H5LWJ2_9AGAR|nr:hypothetical protein D9758_004979 [Tetrapyrgos nigripes]